MLRDKYCKSNILWIEYISLLDKQLSRTVFIDVQLMAFSTRISAVLDAEFCGTECFQRKSIHEIFDGGIFRNIFYFMVKSRSCNSVRGNGIRHIVSMSLYELLKLACCGLYFTQYYICPEICDVLTFQTTRVS